MNRKLWLGMGLTIVLLTAVVLGGLYTAQRTPAAPSEPTCAGAATPGADLTRAGLIRLQRVLAKARRGEPIVVAGIGGSITEGMNATASSRRYLNLVYDWWNGKYPGQVTLINAGIGGTGSAIGTHRAEMDLLINQPDFVLVDAAVNDLGASGRRQTFEGLLRKILSQANQPAVIPIYFMTTAGATTQADFVPIAECYQLPQVSFVDRIDQLIQAGQTTLAEVISDDVHPSDKGHAYAAEFIIEYLDSAYNSLPANAADIPAVEPLPAPLYTDAFQYTQLYNHTNIEPGRTGKWRFGFFDRGQGTGWTGLQAGGELTFNEILGTAVGVVVRLQRDENYGMAEIWVDDGPPIKVDAYLPAAAGPGSGPNSQYYLVAENLPLARHTVHVRISPDKNPETGANTQHTFELMSLLVAGAVVDKLDHWGYVYTRTENLALTIGQSDLRDGDTSRAARTGTDPAEIVWHYRNLSDFEAVFFEPPEAPAQPNEFYASPDGLNWKRVSPTVTGGQGNWRKSVYTLSRLTNVNYVKIRWGPGDPAGAPELGQVTIFRVPRGQ